MTRPTPKIIYTPHDPRAFSYWNLFMVCLWGAMLIMCAVHRFTVAVPLFIVIAILHWFRSAFPPKPEGRIDVKAWQAACAQERHEMAVARNHERYEQSRKDDPDESRFAPPPPLRWEK
jgi:hypothetical protein